MTTAYIRTSDRNSFRGCRRLWGWSSGLRDNLGTNEPYTPFWLGSGLHYAFEDLHGYNLFGGGAAALKGYVQACRKTKGLILPDDWREAYELGVEMLNFYEKSWLKGRDPLKTLWIDNIPQVEIRAQIPLPFKTKEYDKVVYDLTIDRVVVDEHDRLWLLDYKSAIRFETSHLDTDPQVTAYCWAGNVLYDRPIEGMIYQQHRKAIPDQPRILQGGTISTAKNQVTTHRLYKDALINLYGKVEKAPAGNIRCLNTLAEQETENRDAFVRRDWIERSNHQMAAEGQKILQEAEEMFNPTLNLYPNPTRSCGRCFFLLPCIAKDNGDDWESILKDITTTRPEERDEWRKHLNP